MFIESWGYFPIVQTFYIFQGVKLASILHLLRILRPFYEVVIYPHKPILSSITVVISLAQKASVFAILDHLHKRFHYLRLFFAGIIFFEYWRPLCVYILFWIFYYGNAEILLFSGWFFCPVLGITYSRTLLVLRVSVEE